MNVIMRPSLLLVALLLLGTLAPAARADDSAMKLPADSSAMAHYTHGNRLYRLRKFEEAIAEYQAGAMIEPVLVFDYNLGQCYRQLGKYVEAIWHYERFLKHGQPDGERQALITGFLSQMRAELKQKAMSQPPTDSSPDPGPPGVQPRPAPAPLTAGPPERREGISLRRKLAIGVGSAGVAVVGLGLALGLRARSFKDDAAEICPMNPCARSDDANKVLDRGKANARYANVSFGVGGAAILGAIVLWIFGSPAEHKSTAIAPQVSSNFAGIAASIEF
jgi:tetratricopeptide (TPR) repeat protein